MRVFVDTNVLLDVLGKRLPFYDDAAAIWTLAERQQIDAIISAISFTNIFYIVRKLESGKAAMKALRQLRQVFSIAACDETVIDEALQSELADFEDAVQLITALHSQATCLVTRNPKHFSNDSLPILTPNEFITQDDIDLLLS
jgi:predicted nucleic acid-binding protein